MEQHYFIARLDGLKIFYPLYDVWLIHFARIDITCFRDRDTWGWSKWYIAVFKIILELDFSTLTLAHEKLDILQLSKLDWNLP